MRKLTSFNFISLDGYLNDPYQDISWHTHGEEENQFAAEQLKSGNTLIFGRKTYEMMAAYWSTSMAMENDPVVAEGMNNADKIVVSRTLFRAYWNNTKIIKEDLINEIYRLKQSAGKDITLLGSGSVLRQFAENGLIDEYAIMIDPVAIGGGTPIFNDIHQKLNLKLASVKTFKSGVILLNYRT